MTVTNDVVYRMSPDRSEMHELQGRGFLADMLRPSTAWEESYIHPDDQAMVEAAISQAIRTQSIFELEHRVSNAEGRLVWVLSRAVPIKDAAGQIVEWQGAARDVTTRHKVEERHRSDLERQVQERTAELKASRDLLQATMDTSMDMIQVFEAVRNEAGEIVDVR